MHDSSLPSVFIRMLVYPFCITSVPDFNYFIRLAKTTEIRNEIHRPCTKRPTDFEYDFKFSCVSALELKDALRFPLCS